MLWINFSPTYTKTELKLPWQLCGRASTSSVGSHGFDPRLHHSKHVKRIPVNSLAWCLTRKWQYWPLLSWPYGEVLYQAWTDYVVRTCFLNKLELKTLTWAFLIFFFKLSTSTSLVSVFCFLASVGRSSGGMKAFSLSFFLFSVTLLCLAWEKPMYRQINFT